MKNLSAILVATLSAATALAAEPVSVAYRRGLPQVEYAAGKLAEALKEAGSGH